MKRLTKAVNIIAYIFLALLTFNVYQTKKAVESITAINNGHQSARSDVYEFTDASNYLSTQAKQYIASGNVEYLENYLREYKTDKRREESIKRLEEGGGSDLPEVALLKETLADSNELSKHEMKALKLVANANKVDKELLNSLECEAMSEYERTCSAESAKYLAVDILFGADYLKARENIEKKLGECVELIKENTLESNNDGLDKVVNYLNFQYILIVLTTVFIIGFSVVYFWGKNEDDDSEFDVYGELRVKEEKK